MNTYLICVNELTQPQLKEQSAVDMRVYTHARMQGSVPTADVLFVFVL